ncbi:MAG: molybdopterin converting factor subunit 1 [Tepidimonas sp.]|nr:molybdopterin converting factor subunit 1 [Tepidimonas sp.]
MRITVKYFAALREQLGVAEEVLDSEAATLGALREQLRGRGGVWLAALDPQRPVRMALDQAMAGADAALHDGAEVAFFPPVTGG